jgi:hypothetical protein
MRQLCWETTPLEVGSQELTTIIATINQHAECLGEAS